jgi:hypothetical protein
MIVDPDRVAAVIDALPAEGRVLSLEVDLDGAVLTDC